MGGQSKIKREKFALETTLWHRRSKHLLDAFDKVMTRDGYTAVARDEKPDNTGVATQLTWPDCGEPSLQFGINRATIPMLEGEMYQKYPFIFHLLVTDQLRKTPEAFEEKRFEVHLCNWRVGMDAVHEDVVVGKGKFSLTDNNWCYQWSGMKESLEWTYEHLVKQVTLKEALQEPF